MNQPFQCACGIKTREPFYISGTLMCAVCAESLAPRLVSSRAARSWKEFTEMERKVPTSKGRTVWR